MTIPFKIDLTGNTVVVTGGGGVLCGCLARAVAECGANVAVLDLRKEAADAVSNEIAGTGGRALAVVCDVLDKKSLEKANSVVEEAFGPVDILINGAGGNDPKGTTAKEYLFPEDLSEDAKEMTTFYDLDSEGVEFVFNLNFLGCFLSAQVFSRSMARKQNGLIINISSMNALTPLTKVSAYSAAKAAVSNFTLWLAVHMSKVGVRVNAIAPGFFLTEQNRSLLMDDRGNLTERGRKVIDHTPMGRFGNAQDLIGVTLWLISDKSSGFVTGAVVPVDGGFSAFSGV